MSRSWTGGSTRAWRKVRARVLLRDGYRCQLQRKGCTGTATQAHHTQGRAVTGDDERYLVASCAHCNQSLGDPQQRADPPVRVTAEWWS